MKHTMFWIALLALFIVHHDWWLWDDGRLMFGFLPVGLAYQAGISLAAAGLWAWAVFGTWPELFDAEALAADKRRASPPATRI